MKFSVPTVWDDRLIAGLKGGSDRVELYGKLDDDCVGGGRPVFLLPHVGKRQAREHIEQVHESGMAFNYLLNPLCLGNLESTRGGQKRIRRLLDWLAECGVDTITVSNAFLLQMAKKCYPRFRVSVSSFVGIHTIEKVKRWQDLGADVITLDAITINREFSLLKKIRSAARCELQLIANNCCLYHCPFVPYHGTVVAHASRFSDPLRGFMLEYCVLNCKCRRLANPVEFIRAGWVRPEDIHYYEDVGIDSLKLVDRTRPVETIIGIARAYFSRRHEGNLLDLFPTLSSDRTFFHRNKLARALKYFFHPFLANPLSLIRLAKMPLTLDVHIDNRALDGFLEHFLKDNCHEKDCRDCGYCQRVADKAVRIDPEYQKKTVARYEQLISGIISGDLLNYRKHV